MKLESNGRTIAEGTTAIGSMFFDHIDYGTISDEIINILEKHKVPIFYLENVFHDVRLKAEWYSPVQNYHGDSD